jgi:lipopolysaccharide/colanic/teichoic acid biosynthesis glycosyltransferase
MAQTSASYPSTTYRPVEGSSKFRRIDDLLKRLFDIFIAGASLLLLSPIFLYLILRIKRDSLGPVFYRGPRIGRNGRMFNILKFRTMYETPQSYQGPRITAQNDPRITPLGRWLRDTKLNEFPQLWNVLKGDMSLVGPRPEDPAIAATWPEDVRAEILSVRPGITSPASVLYHDEESRLIVGRVMDTYLDEILPSKLRLDQLYVRYRSIWGDLDIMFWTALVLLPQVKAHTPPEGKLFVGPVTRLARRHMSWFLADTFVTFLAMGVTGLFWRSLGPLNVGWLPAFVLALGFAILFSLTNALLGVNRIEWSRAAASDVLDLLPGAGLATLLALLFNYFYPAKLAAMLYGGEIPPWLTRPFLPPGLILMASVLALFGFVLVRYRSRLVTGLATRWVHWRNVVPTAQERVLIVGGGETGRFAAWMLNQGRYASTFRVVGFVDDDLHKQDTRIHGTQVLGPRSQIPELVVQHDIGIIVFAIHNISPAERRQLLDICSITLARVVLFPDLPAALSGLTDKQQTSLQDASPASPDILHFENSGRLPCNLCLVKVSPLKVDSWLAQLEETASNGDLEKLQTQILDLRSQLRGDVSVQAAANLADEEF